MFDFDPLTKVCLDVNLISALFKIVKFNENVLNSAIFNCHPEDKFIT